MQQPGPMQFGPYLVLEQIGAGGMGAVYRARDLRLEREVAIKVLHSHLEMAGARERFLREARAVSSLSHPNICTVFDIGEERGDPYLVMELLKGESLKERIHNREPMIEADLKAVGIQMGMALAAAHGKGIVHRDIKPANLFLVENPAGEIQIKVLDFGLAKLESDRLLYGESGQLTRTGSTVGTVEYMSPEQARGLELDPRSDLFSFGAVLYEMATGDVPFVGATSAVVFSELLGKDPVPARTKNTALSVEMDRIIRRLLVKDRDGRMQSAGEMADAFREMGRSRLTGVRAAVAAPVKAVTTGPEPEVVVPVTADKPAWSGPDRRTRSEVRNPSQERRTAQSISDPTARFVRQRRPSTSRITAGVTRASSRDTMQIAVPVQESVTDAPAGEVSHSQTRLWVVGALMLLAIAAIGGYYVSRGVGATVGANVVDGTLQMTTFENSTGDELLDDLPAVALQVLLAESTVVKLADYAPTQVQQTSSAQATASGSAAYVTGTISSQGSTYRIRAQILRTGDGTRLASEEAYAASIVELPTALSQLAVALRAHLGETPEQAAANSVPLSVEATASLTALASYGRGTSLLRAGSAVSAAEQFARASNDDPAFALARMDRSEALRIAGAEPEAAAAIEPLRSKEQKGSECQRDRIIFMLSAPEAGLDTAQKWATTCGGMSQAQVALSRMLLLNGRPADAETAGNRALALDPLSHEANSASTLAMLAEDHYESALKLQQKATAAQVSSAGLTLMAAYLRGDAGAQSQALAALQTSQSWEDQWAYVTVLANQGRIAAAVQYGQTVAARRAAQPTIASSAVRIRARLAAIESMAGHCGTSAALTPSVDALLPTAPATVFFSALAAGWCHRRPPAEVRLTGVAYVTLLPVLVAWGSGDATTAITDLQAAKPSSTGPIVGTIRGELHLQQKQNIFAIGAFESVLTHRGAALLTGAIVYPAAQAGLASTYKSMGDEPNSTRIQAALKSTWSAADANEPLLQRVSHQAAPN